MPRGNRAVGAQAVRGPEASRALELETPHHQALGVGALDPAFAGDGPLNWLNGRTTL